VDLRRGHDRLVAIVRSTWRLDPFGGHFVVFLGRRLDRVNILVSDRNGFVLYYKRLSQGHFRIPKIGSGAAHVQMDATTLATLLDGIDVRYLQRPAKCAPPPPATPPD
jgi:transposase